MSTFGNIKTDLDLVQASLDLANNFKTLYVLGSFGWPMTEEKKQRAKNGQAFNRKTERAKKIDAATIYTKTRPGNSDSGRAGLHYLPCPPGGGSHHRCGSFLRT